MEEKGNKIDRRNFFLKAGKLVIPTLGILGLSLVTRSVQAACVDCDGSCRGSAGRERPGCSDCTGGCKGDCGKACSYECNFNCSGSCGRTANK